MTSKLEMRLKEMGLTLPPPFQYPKANRTGCILVGNIVFVSGHGRDLQVLPGVKGAGKIPAQVSEHEGYATARAVALTILATLKKELGDLDRVMRVIRLFGMVNVSPGYQRMPNVIDGASDFFYELFGPINGKHARSAIGVAELPHAIPIEINGEFEIHR
ncbi:MAG: RidA family protein [Betaproteobacteria bacterium]|nr:MAG: RidA family protein [Betaproteobacteria bacterium]